jgi:hypothetical protein
MSNPIFARLEQEAGILINHGKLDATEFQRVWRRIRDRSETPEYDSPNRIPANRYGFPKENPVSVLDDLRTDLENTLENHRQVIEDALAVADKVANNKLAQSALEGFAHVPPSIVQDAIDTLQKLDVEFAKITPAAVAETTPEPAGDPQIQTGVAT